MPFGRMPSRFVSLRLFREKPARFGSCPQSHFRAASAAAPHTSALLLLLLHLSSHIPPAGMKLLSLHIFRRSGPKPFVMTYCFDLSSLSFWQRPTAKEVALFVCREVVARLPAGMQDFTTFFCRLIVANAAGGFDSFQHKSFICHVRITDEFSAACTTDEEYPNRVALEFLGIAIRKFAEIYPSVTSTLPEGQV